MGYRVVPRRTRHVRDRHRRGARAVQHHRQGEARRVLLLQQARALSHAPGQGLLDHPQAHGLEHPGQDQPYLTDHPAEVEHPAPSGLRLALRQVPRSPRLRPLGEGLLAHRGCVRNVPARVQRDAERSLGRGDGRLLRRLLPGPHRLRSGASLVLLRAGGGLRGMGHHERVLRGAHARGRVRDTRPQG